MTEKKTALVTIRLAGVTKQRAVKAAQLDGRKLSPWIELLILDALKKGKAK